MWFRSISCLFIFACICTNHAFSDDSYTKHCSSVIDSHDNVTARSYKDSLPSLSTPYFTGGDSLIRMETGRNYHYVQKNLKLQLRPNCYKTAAAGVYKVEGFLDIRFPYSSDDVPANYSYGGYNRRRNRAGGAIKFPMKGFWSEKSRKLCMVGSASWRGSNRDAVLKLKFNDEKPSVYSGVVSGSLESTASTHDPPYFGPVLIFGFPEVSSYSYSLITKEGFPSQKNESLSLDATEFCSVMKQGLRSLELECAERRPQGCSPLDVGDGDGDGFLPRFLSLTSIQCVDGEKKARFIATFLNYSGYGYGYDEIGLSSTVIGEAWWDGKNNRMVGVACELLNPSHHLGNVVGNCSMRLIIRHPAVLTMRNDAKIVGQIWSSKGVDDSGYFPQINIAASNEIRVVALPDQKYAYTELDRARKSCTAAKKAAKKGDVYPDGQSYDMRFDMNIKNGQGQKLAWASATPLWVDNDPYEDGSDGDMVYAAQESTAVVEPDQKRGSALPTKMSYKIRIYSHYHHVNSSYNISSPSLNWPVSSSGRVDITAEGLYDAANGLLCMVGCRKLAENWTSNFKDCEVVMEFELPPLNGGGRGGLTKGTLRSTRPKKDPLHFDDLTLHAAAYYREEAERSIWRMDLEIAMVLISNTLVCIFVALQIFHVKRNPDQVPSSVSLVMLVVLSVGHMIPLVLNFEAMFLEDRGKTTLELGSGGKLETNEVAVRVITMVALLLQLRLFQIVWTAKQSEHNGKSSWSGEKKAGFVSLSLYIVGALLALMFNWMRKTYFGLGRRYSVWGDLRSYAGLILDGFLVPQILLNILRGSAEKALSHPFYIGISAVRLVPHAYNQYRAHNYPKFDLNVTYYYANPAGDLYSIAWDIIIPCGILALAVIVFVQQRHGGRCILPQRFRGLEMYEKVPTAENQ